MMVVVVGRVLAAGVWVAVGLGLITDSVWRCPSFCSRCSCPLFRPPGAPPIIQQRLPKTWAGTNAGTSGRGRHQQTGC